MPTKDDLHAQWDSIAPAWIEKMRGSGDPSRTGLLDDWMLDAVGDVCGLSVVDLGCGEGRFGRMLAQRGAHVTGVDICAEMIQAASAACVGGERYVVGDMENLAGIADAQFDLAVSYVTLVDVVNLPAALREAWRILRPGGRFVVCNLSPMVTAGNHWVKDEQGRKLHFCLDNYLAEDVRPMRMFGRNVDNFHRTFSTYINGFLQAGFVLEGIREPYPLPHQFERCPDNVSDLRVPLFIIYLLRKRNR